MVDESPYARLLLSSSYPSWLIKIIISIALALMLHFLFRGRKKEPSGGGGDYAIGTEDEGRMLDESWTTKKRNAAAEAALARFKREEEETAVNNGDRCDTNTLREHGKHNENHHYDDKKDYDDYDDIDMDKTNENDSLEKTPTSSTNNSNGGADGNNRTSRRQQSRVSRHLQRRNNNNNNLSTNTPKPRPSLRTTQDHPGFNSFHTWHSAIAGIYREYRVAPQPPSSSSHPHVEIPPLIIPKSERGHVRVHLHVTNATFHRIHVYWVDYLGREIRKGFIPSNGGVWKQITYIGHPWTFRRAVATASSFSHGEEEEQLLLHFVPYRVIPNTRRVNTLSEDNEYEYEVEGVQRFAIREPHAIPHSAASTLAAQHDAGDPNLEFAAAAASSSCDVDDPVFAHPSSKITTFDAAVRFALDQMEREQLHDASSQPQVLLKYLYNILHHPSESKYRQIRVSNRVFWNQVWITGMRGILHALGFVEYGAFVEMGPDSGSLSAERLKQVGEAIFEVENWLKQWNDGGDNRGEGDIRSSGNSSNNEGEEEAGGTARGGEGGSGDVRQPVGADGYGRAGFGRVGGLNL